MTIDRVQQLLRNSRKPSSARDASVLMCAMSFLPGLDKSIACGRWQDVESLIKCSDITNHIFVPMSMLRLSHSLYTNSLYAEHMIAGCSLDAIRNCVDASILVGLMSSDLPFSIAGSVGVFRGNMSRFGDHAATVVTSDPICAQKITELMSRQGFHIPVSLDNCLQRVKMASSQESFRIKLPRFGIDKVYEAGSSDEALQMALDQAYEQDPSRHYNRRRPKQFTASFYLSDPVIAADVVEHVPHTKKASIIGLDVGDMVETKSTNGFFGGLRGRVASVKGSQVMVNFNNGKTVTYNMDEPISASSIQKIRRI
jgi:hypothetical protein